MKGALRTAILPMILAISLKKHSGNILVGNLAVIIKEVKSPSVIYVWTMVRL